MLNELTEERNLMEFVDVDQMITLASENQHWYQVLEGHSLKNDINYFNYVQ